jgi:hypothetical protein
VDGDVGAGSVDVDADITGRARGRLFVARHVSRRLRIERHRDECRWRHWCANTSKCDPHRTFIDAQMRLGRNATAIYQDLVDQHGFDGAYNSVKRYCASFATRSPNSSTA